MMKSKERREALIKLLEANKQMKVNDIIEQLGCAPATIRRDLRDLEKQGAITRAHGYAQISGLNTVRQVNISKSMLAIGRCAAELVGAGECIILGDGCITQAMAIQLPQNQEINVVTNSLNVVNCLQSSAAVITLVGGKLDNRHKSFYGSTAARYVEEIRARTLFLEVSGICPPDALMCHSIECVDCYQAMIRSVQSVVVLAEASTLRQSGGFQFGTLRDVAKIITDEPIGDIELEKQLAGHRIELVYAG